ncbi:MAG: tetratricopeptide repeat protein [Francisellaceae bacterium]|jgi:tetratricopeptide (TPR) repeat protein|nr:tetratricopeptide repeat protein [Francisellaceae bacterium]MBT6539067.1 tetratricopeptide repeat protein [Francisellaceae bacterium]
MAANELNLELPFKIRDILKEIESGNNEHAEYLLKDLKKRNPHSVVVLEAEASILFRQGEYDKARDIGNKVLAMDEKRPMMCMLLGDIEIREKRHREAIDFYSKALSLNSLLTAARIKVADIYFSLGEYGLAKDNYLLSSSLSSETLNKIGLINVAELKMFDAIVCFSEAELYSDGNTSYSANLAMAYFENREYDKSKETYERALNSNLEVSLEFRRGYVNVLLELGELDKAGEVVRKLDDNLSWVRHLQGLLYHKMGEYTLALDCFNELLDSDKFLHESCLCKGLVLKDIGELYSALEVFDEIISKYRDGCSVKKSIVKMALKTSGDIFSKLGQSDQAAKCNDVISKI